MPALIICEKPRVARKIASVLGEGRVRKIRERGIDYYKVERGGKELFIAAAVGHLYSLKPKNGKRGYPVFDVEWAPIYEVSRESRYARPYLEVLKHLGRMCEEHINACDFDIEGSLIGANIIRLACEVPLERALRMKFSALTKDDLVSAYENMMPFDVLNAMAGETRHILDWYYGINLSRALMEALRRCGIRRIMSIGRVQGPALHLLSKREREIARFVPQPFWQVFAHYGKLKLLHVKERFEKREQALLVKERSERGKEDAKVEWLSREEKSVPPNPPFDLTSLQVEAFRCLKYTPAQTLEIAQALYEASLISYPRTSSQKLPPKLNLRNIIHRLSSNPRYEREARFLIEEGRYKPREGKKDDPAHPAIHPTGVLPEKRLSKREEKLYDLIVRRFLACFGRWARRETIKLRINVGGEQFKASGTRILERGWMDIYEPYVKIEEAEFPEMEEGEGIVITKIEVRKGMTKPPKRYTVASIVQELERRGLGTKATRAVIIETLGKRGYIKGRTTLEVTPFGLAVDETLQKHCGEILDEKLTREFEEKMERIAQGKLSEEEVIKEGREVLTRILERFKKEEEAIGKELTRVFIKEREDAVVGRCPRCGGELRLVRSRRGKIYVACSEFPKCTQSYPVPQRGKIMPTEKVCKECGTPIIKVIIGRKVYEMCLDPNCLKKRGEKGAGGGG